MTQFNDKLKATDPDDIGYNDTQNPDFHSVLSTRISRRNLLRGSAATIASTVLGGGLLSACGANSAGADNKEGATPIKETLLGFAPVAKSLLDQVIVPAGYTASVLYALGDPLDANTPAFKNDGSDQDFERRAGDHHDGMEWFGLNADGKASQFANERGLLAVNHEATTDEKLSSFFLHSNGGTASLPRPAAEIDKETAIHGISVVEVRKTDKAWQYVPSSPFNFRLTCLSEIDLSGPVRGSSLVITAFSNTGVKARGTLNNCGTGKTPWNSFVSGEENWAGYFTRGVADDAARGNDKSVVALKRYGRAQGAASRHGWESGGNADKYLRWNISKWGSSSDGRDDYRNELNTMGYIIELDPYDKTKPAKKRTALGRFAHESAAFSKPVAGKPLAVYMGDDSRNEYIYKFVSSANWDAADAQTNQAMSIGDKYLDQGKLYVAKFNTDGSGNWIELSLSNPLIAHFANYPFADHADICANTRLAADAVGATKMDRPEWCSVNPANGEVYYSLTNNSNRNLNPSSGSQLVPDSANPRAYSDMKGSTEQKGNPNGHILRLREASEGAAATSFTWDVYLFAAEAGADASKVNLSSLTHDQDMSSPDGLAFSASTGICWIQTDDGAYTDVSNCMMLAALPGQVGDGNKVELQYTKSNGSPLTVTTYVGKKPGSESLKRFLVGPVACEITGIAETPDGKTLFVNIQHPGETTSAANVGDASKYSSQWPSNAGYGAGKRPRSATIVITKNDGGRIGS